MVKIAAAGGTGNIATELLRAPIASGKHDITILTRSDPPPTERVPGVAYQKVDYTDVAALTDILRGTDVVFSFIIAHLDTDCVTQKNLIAACIAAGVRRFAPSEWGIKNDSGVDVYANKDAIAAHLAHINRHELVLEYCLFQPSVFTDYFAHPHPPSPNLITWPFFIDPESRRAIILDKGDQPISLTTIADSSAILALALDDPRPWPSVGGVTGERTTMADVLKIAQAARGGDWVVETVSSEDIRRGELKTQWTPKLEHPVVPLEEREKFSAVFVIMFLNAIAGGAWDTGTEWNERFPEYKFTGVQEVIRGAWVDK